jgi:hypothetical protein
VLSTVSFNFNLRPYSEALGGSVRGWDWAEGASEWDDVSEYSGTGNFSGGGGGGVGKG